MSNIGKFGKDGNPKANTDYTYCKPKRGECKKKCWRNHNNWSFPRNNYYSFTSECIYNQESEVSIDE